MSGTHCEHTFTWPLRRQLRHTQQRRTTQARPHSGQVGHAAAVEGAAAGKGVAAVGDCMKHAVIVGPVLDRSRPADSLTHLQKHGRFPPLV